MRLAWVTMLRSRFLIPSVALLCLGQAVSACGDDAGTGGGGGGSGGKGGQGGGGGTIEPEVCDGHAVSSTLSFIDRTPEWGLVGVAGGRVTSGDVNGDGYPDLLVHNFYPGCSPAPCAPEREVIGQGTRRTYLLINEPGPGGGRIFVDRTFESGFTAPADGSTTELKSSQLAALADVDSDGDMDIFSGTWNEPNVNNPPSALESDRSEIYLNDGSGNFTLLAGSGVQFQSPRRTSSASFMDFNLDGVLDLFVGVHYSPSGALQSPALYLGAGDGTFTDVTASTGVGTEKRATFGATACDVDDDGLPEILMSAYARGPNVLYQIEGGVFTDVGEASGYAYDENQDWSDNQFFRCWCTVHTADPLCAGVPAPGVVCPNPADGNWSPVSETKPERLGGNTFSTVCADVTGDGQLDLYTAEIAHWWAGGSSDKSNLLVNDGSPGMKHFTRADRSATGLEVPHVGASWNEGGITAAIADLDLDARPDILLGTSDYPDQYGWIFHQKTDGSFEEIGEALGLHHPCAVGLTVADFDRDGDLDVIVASGTARDCGAIWSTNEVHFYESGASGGAGWIAVRPRGAGPGTGANTSGIGARVAVEAGGVRQVQELGSGYGHFGLQNDTVLFFSLGSCTRAAKVEVVWPDGARTTEVFDEVTGGRVIELRQGDPTVYDVVPPAGG